jgi:hypothetical protein
MEKNAKEINACLKMSEFVHTTVFSNRICRRGKSHNPDTEANKDQRGRLAYSQYVHHRQSVHYSTSVTSFGNRLQCVQFPDSSSAIHASTGRARRWLSSINACVGMFDAGGRMTLSIGRAKPASINSSSIRTVC